ncbi:MAG: hypothetical protein AAFP19_13280, partial [Bacteroidota bacterium]
KTRGEYTNKYLQLFEALTKQKAYDEEKLMNTLGYQDQSSSFFVAKNYLYQLIIKSLRNYTSSKSPMYEVMELLQEVEILYHKRLFKDSRRRVIKARKIAEEHFYHHCITLICVWERRLVEQLEVSENIFQSYEAIMSKEEQAVRDLQIEMNYFNQYKALFFYNLQSGCINDPAERASFIAQFSNALPKDINLPTTPLSKLFLFSFWSVYHEAIRDSRQQMYWNQQIIKLFESTPILKKTYQENYLLALIAYLYNLIELSRVKEYLEERSLLIALDVDASIFDMLQKRELGLLFLESYYWSRIGRFNQIVKVDMIQRIKDYFEKKAWLINDKYEVHLCSIVNWAFICTYQYEMALEWNIQMGRHIDKNNFVDFYIHNQLIKLIIHYELKNFRLLNSLVQSAQRFLFKKNKLNSKESAILYFFKKGRHFSIRREEREALYQLRKQLFDQKKQMDQSLLYNRDIGYWVDGKCQYKSIGKVVEEAFAQQAKDSKKS